MSGGPWVLVVEDEDDIRELIVLFLSTSGYRVEAASNGVDALDRIRALGSPGLILLDLRMPRMSGPDFARALRANPRWATTPIVVLSGDATADLTAAALGARACLTKPVQLNALLGAVAGFVTAG